MMLLLLLSAAPSAAALAANGQAHGMLIRAQQVTAAPAEEVPLERMTRAQLREEYQRIDENRPGIAGQIVATALGGACIGFGVLTLYGSLIMGIGGRVPMVGLAVGLGLAIGGAGLLIFGIVMLKMALRERQPYGERMDEIQQRLDGTWEEHDSPRGAPPPPPPPSSVPPSPPPPPPSAVGIPPPPPMFVLARF